jgi:hypothetical protein
VSSDRMGRWPSGHGGYLGRPPADTPLPGRGAVVHPDPRCTWGFPGRRGVCRATHVGSRPRSMLGGSGGVRLRSVRTRAWSRPCRLPLPEALGRQLDKRRPIAETAEPDWPRIYPSTYDAQSREGTLG